MTNSAGHSHIMLKFFACEEKNSQKVAVDSIQINDSYPNSSHLKVQTIWLNYC